MASARGSDRGAPVGRVPRGARRRSRNRKHPSGGHPGRVTEGLEGPRAGGSSAALPGDEAPRHEGGKEVAGNERGRRGARECTGRERKGAPARRDAVRAHARATLPAPQRTDRQRHGRSRRVDPRRRALTRAVRRREGAVVRRKARSGGVHPRAPEKCYAGCTGTQRWSGCEGVGWCLELAG